MISLTAVTSVVSPHSEVNLPTVVPAFMIVFFLNPTFALLRSDCAAANELL